MTGTEKICARRLFKNGQKMSNEIDIVNQLLSNEKPAEVTKPKKKKATGLVLTTPTAADIAARGPHVKHLDPEVKPKDASPEKVKGEHWTGDCIQLSKEQKQSAGLPDLSYFVVKRTAGPNGSSCVYDPVHWIYGWGDCTTDAVKDCLNNIKDWRVENPTKVGEVIAGWEERLAKYKHPFKFASQDAPAPTKYKTKDLVSEEDKTTADILSSIGLE